MFESFKLGNIEFCCVHSDVNYTEHDSRSFSDAGNATTFIMKHYNNSDAALPITPFQPQQDGKYSSSSLYHCCIYVK